MNGIPIFRTHPEQWYSTDQEVLRVVGGIEPDNAAAYRQPLPSGQQRQISDRGEDVEAVV
nr:hypothetical protein ISGA_5678 [Gordonia sp. NB41Y]